MVLFDDCHVAVAVMSLVVLSASVATAVNCNVAFGATEVEEAVTAIETTGFATVRTACPVTPPEEAVMLLVPVATAVTTPPVVIVATPVLEDSQFADDVKDLVVPSL
jgi:hypothetical protein